MEIFAPNFTQSGVRRKSIRSQRNGFTLIELLAVMAIIGIMASVSMAIAPSLFQSNRFTQNILTVSGIMEMARQHAITNNTYVWVAFSDPTPEGVYVATIESKEGTNGLADPSTGAWENSGTSLTAAKYANLSLLRKVQLIPSLSLSHDTTRSISGMPSTSGTVQSMQEIQLIIPVAKIDRKFTRAVQFTPIGEAGVSTSGSYVQVCMQPATNPSSTPNFAILRLAGITGKLNVYRPN